MAETIVLYATPEHLNSMLTIAKFIAKHHQEVHVTILCTASTSAAAAVAAIPSITYLRLPDAVTPPANHETHALELLFEIPRLHKPILTEALQEISKKSRIRAFVIDFFCNSAFEVSKSLNIPTYYHISSGGYGLCVFLYFPTIHETIREDIGTLNDFLDIPGCPRVHSSDIPFGMQFRESNIYKHFLDTAINIGRSDGILVDSFDALETQAKDALVKDLCTPNSKTPPVYFLGPLIPDSVSKNGVTEQECLKWLDLQPTRSVIFLCFGRRGRLSAEQLKEMAVGLENSGHRFLWAVRNPPGNPRSPSPEEPDLDAILPQGFLERTRDRGFVLKSWAPQKEVLSHESVGGFVTHCGRSSALESVSFGVPMICWPLYAEQKMQRVFMVEGMKVALRLEMADDGFVTAAEIEKQVRELMDSENGNQIRKRLAQMKHAGKAAVEKGGSSLVDLEKFIRRFN
ncbi:LOW QUALITY PROTEIN: baicalein 7-O-glucuronosyltransferase-like [Primulina tabacum]|uniref:LOW QUALITY PROTEIN: baicalein 7-O-glucuronosyltransferase-like n=1 Tax=Primulina tabacum TaxID=48773 RepID=UPI003F59D32B